MLPEGEDPRTIEAAKKIVEEDLANLVILGNPEEIDVPGATVIDVGMDRDEDGRLCGDVDYDDVFNVAGAITPVPGGVGPMTRAMLMSNVVTAARMQAEA